MPEVAADAETSLALLSAACSMVLDDAGVGGGATAAAAAAAAAAQEEEEAGVDVDGAVGGAAGTV